MTLRKVRTNVEIKINKQQFFECLVAVLLVLNGQSMWSKLETVQGWFSWLILGMLWIAAIGILYCSNSGKVEKQTVFSIFLITVYLAVYICVRPVNFNGTLQLVLSVIAISMIVFETKDISGILQYYRKTIIIIATISLFFWVFGSMLSYLQPSSEIYSIWTGNGDHVLVKNYYYLYFQQQMSNIKQIDAVRNIAFFCEAPMAAFHFSIAFLIEMFFRKRPSRINIIILVVATLSTISITGYLVLLAGFSAKYLLSNSKQKLIHAIKVVSVPIAIGLVVCIMLYLYNLKADSASGYARLNDFAVGYQVWKKHFLFGVGYGNYDEIKKMMPLWRSSNTGFSNSIMLVVDYGGLYFGVAYLFSIIKGMIGAVKYKKYNSLSFLLIFTCIFIVTNIPFIYLTLLIVLSQLEKTMKYSEDN